ncbi:hypothetical protein BPOR_0099g00190 [Botrytis porri]|uniref:Uncharacterized protein n=1 Tax=Botrytis porri TaxID=87229 RepID=A0A4Z1KYS7_9HELO|nr:hypothetical protein BPOR_0099g00190 [Botrytis porri]
MLLSSFDPLSILALYLESTEEHSAMIWDVGCAVDLQRSRWKLEAQSNHNATIQAPKTVEPVIDQKCPSKLIPEAPLTLTSTGGVVAVDELLDPEVTELVVVEGVPKTLERADPVPRKNSLSMLTSV